MSGQVIDLTISDDEVTAAKQPMSATLAPNEAPVPRRSSRNRNVKSVVQTEGAEPAGDSQRNEPSTSKGSSRKIKSDKVEEPNDEQPKSNRSSNGSASLLSRLGDVVQANEEDNKSKRKSRDRPGREGKFKERDRKVTQESQVLTSSVRRPRSRSRSRSPNLPVEIPLSEVPFEELFFIDTGPVVEANESSTEPATPLDASSSTPNDTEAPSARAVKRKLAKERKKEKKLEAAQAGEEAPTDASGEAAEIEFVGGDALAVDSAVVSASTTQLATEITPSTTAVTNSTKLEVAQQKLNGSTQVISLALPAHVTLWTEGDPDISLADISAGAPEPVEGVEYMDYEGDQATGIVRYFITEGTAPKKLCRTCGEEGHIAKFCKKLICLTCGERDDHDTRNCPMRVVCFNCGGKGHVVSVRCLCWYYRLLANSFLKTQTCPQPRGRAGCDRCGSATHILQRCPEQFKTYIYLSDAERLEVLKERTTLESLSFGEGGEGYIARHIWCYNCGGAGHWGDDCQESRPYSTPDDPCAFGSHNASRGPFGDSGDGLVGSQDVHRPAWMDDDPHLQDVGRRAKEANMKRNRAAEASRSARERDDDDWFSRKTGAQFDEACT
ncbi:hypothetical protein BDV93DRAFT_270854 [Ceratobasidium sp. AG-I]|nr:hypothetical protein BDV93DRAFT_270854 [Ceratobasidium sp. AG-I]